MADEAPSEQRGSLAPSLLRPGKRASARGTHIVRELVETLLLTLAVFFAVQFAVQAYYVQGPSMQPGLYTGERVLVNKLAYRFGTPQRGDIVVLRTPDDPQGEPLIKRIIAVPGDTLTISPEGVFVNGKKINEPYTYPLPKGEPVHSPYFQDLKIAKDRYFVMGDHRDDSLDSRVFGGVPGENIIGKAELVMLPLDKIHILDTYYDEFKAAAK